ncbi:MAG: hypothetical protein U1C57_03775 [Candidatus Doudnabacteria bacterium]|nr:hypothetical protein [bacterium]MDZ4244196.1 hypothetical protein [Candidatus Doudnabacteria bacterium]
MPTKKFTIEKIDEKTAKKIDTMESTSIINIEGLRKQKIELEQEVVRLNKELAQTNEIISEFEKLP